MQRNSFILKNAVDICFNYSWKKIPVHKPGCCYYATRTSGNDAAKTSKPNDSLQFCQNLVKQYDYENFLSTLLLPPGSREAVLAVRAFNVSLAQIRDSVSQKLAGDMRLQFWKDSLEGVYSGNPPAQPIALQLWKALSRHKLSRRWFLRLIDSREETLTDRAFSSLEALEKYSENSVSSVLYLTLEALGLRNVHADHAASHIGRAQGCVTIIRGLPHNAQRKIVYVPLDLLVKHRVSQQQLIKGSTETNVKDLVFDIAGVANAHLEKAKSLKPQLPKESLVAMLPAVSVSSYLDRLRKADFNVFDPNLQARNNLLPFHLWWNKVRGNY